MERSKYFRAASRHENNGIILLATKKEEAASSGGCFPRGRGNKACRIANVRGIGMRRREGRRGWNHWRDRALTAFSICSSAFVSVHRGQATFMRRKASPCSPNS